MITSVWSRPGVASGRLALASLAGYLLWPAARPAPLRLPAPAVHLQGHYPGQLPGRFRDIGPRSAFAAGGSSEADRDVAEARKAIEAGNAAWGRARVAIDRNTFERMLAGDFYVVLPDRRLTRDAFIERITHFPYGRVTRFDPTVLTVERRGEAWEAIIMEKLEYDQAGAEGRTIKGYTLAVTRDGWKHTAEGWKVLFSELLGAQMWRDGSPPPMAFW